MGIINAQKTEVGLNNPDSTNALGHYYLKLPILIESGLFHKRLA
jgi:hypothetical protein